MPRDLRGPGSANHYPRVGTYTEKRRYGVAPDGTLDDWVILCTVKGAEGPFVEMREVTVGAWSPIGRTP